MKNLIILSFVLLFVLIQSGSGQVDTVWTKSTGRYYARNIKFTGDGQYIVVGLDNGGPDTSGYVQLLSTSSGTVVWEHQVYGMMDLDVSNDSSLIASVHFDKIILWDLITGDTIHTFDKLLFDSLSKGLVGGLCFSKDSRYLYAGIGQTNNLPKIFKIDLQTDSIVKSKEVLANFIKYSPTSDIIAVAGDINENDHFIKLLDPSTLETDITIILHNKSFTDLAFSSNGQYLASANFDGTAKIFEIPNLNLSQTFSYNNASMSINTIDISSDGKYLVTGGGFYFLTIARIWDIETGNSVYTYHYLDTLDAAICVSISPNMNYLAIGGDMYVYLFNFITDTSSVAINVNPQETRLIYPNPTDGKINIELNIKNRGQYSVKIINEKGNEIQQIGYNTFDVGKHEINWDAGKLPAGVYFIVVRGKNYFKTFKFIKEP